MQDVRVELAQRLVVLGLVFLERSVDLIARVGGPRDSVGVVDRRVIDDVDAAEVAHAGVRGNVRANQQGPGRWCSPCGS